MVLGISSIVFSMLGNQPELQPCVITFMISRISYIYAKLFLPYIFLDLIYYSFATTKYEVAQKFLIANKIFICVFFTFVAFTVYPRAIANCENKPFDGIFATLFLMGSLFGIAIFVVLLLLCLRWFVVRLIEVST